jgi:hypothetical protein
LLPALLKVMKLSPMDDYEALAFRLDLHSALNQSPTVSRNP